jgi:hypothetical protein
MNAPKHGALVFCRCGAEPVLQPCPPRHGKRCWSWRCNTCQATYFLSFEWVEDADTARFDAIAEELTLGTEVS